MAEAAGAKALAASGLEPSEVDLVIVATCSPEVPLPNVAATVAYRLGIPAPGAYDLNAACAGFCYAIGAAADSVRAGSARNVLVIGSEKMTSWVDWTDRSTCIIFADGAGAVVVGPTGGDEPTGGGAGAARWAERRRGRRSRQGSGRSSGAAPVTRGTRSRSPGGPDRCGRTGR